MAFRRMLRLQYSVISYLLAPTCRLRTHQVCTEPCQLGYKDADLREQVRDDILLEQEYIATTAAPTVSSSSRLATIAASMVCSDDKLVTTTAI